MKYIFNNIKLLFQKNKTIFFLIILCEVVSSFIILFSYGAYYNYKIMKNIGTYDLNSSLDISFDEKSIKIDDLVKTLDKISGTVLADCQVIFFWTDSYDNSLNEDISLFFVMEYDNGFKYYNERKFNMVVTDGQFITDEDYKEGKHKIMIPESYKDVKIGDYINVNGTSYEVVCKLQYQSDFYIPIKNAPNDLKIQDISFSPNGIMKLSNYNKITEAFKSGFGNDVLIPEIDTFNDGLDYYNSLSMIIIIITVLSSITLMIVFLFVLEMRKKEFAIFRMCGCTRKRIVFIYTMEIFFTSLISFCITAAIYFISIIDKLSNYLEYMKSAYSLKSVLWLALIYLTTIIIVTLSTVLVKISKTPISQFKRR